MCLGVVATVTRTWDEGGLPMAAISDGRGEERAVCLAYIPDTRPGDSVLVHLGFALERLDPDAAADAQTLRSI
jgi:hydrogenase expression/formation protein HypC